VDPEGRFLGRHAGLIAFTVGQRRGIGIPARDPLYVLELQPEANRLVVGPKPALLAGGLKGVRASWLIEPPREEFAAGAVIRYRHPGVAATIHPGADGSVTVRFAVPQAAVAPGQGVAFYQGDRLLGGAWIADKLRE
jgi:tRNA-specific 2-thiouridylase